MPKTATFQANVSGELISSAKSEIGRFLQKNPEEPSRCTSFWRHRWTPCTPFALEEIEVPISAVACGKSSTAKIDPSSADLLYQTYLVLDVPAIHAQVASNMVMGKDGAEERKNAQCRDDVWVHWANGIAQLLPKKITKNVCGKPVAELYSISMYVWEELSGKPGKRLREMIGKRKTSAQLIEDAKFPQRFYLPLPFAEFQPNNVLPMCALKPVNESAGVTFHIDWEELKHCVVASHPDVRAVKNDGKELCATDINAFLDVTVVHIGKDEREYFRQAPQINMLFKQTQINYFKGSGKIQSHNLSVTGLGTEMVWVVRRERNEEANNWFNFSGENGRDPIVNVAFKVGKDYRFGGRQAQYYRLREPYAIHGNIPKAFIYCKGWVISGETSELCGGFDFSHKQATGQQMKLEIEMSEELKDEPVSTIVIVWSQQILRIKDGTATVMFA